MTNTTTTTLAIDPQRAWEIVLGQLQMEMPRTSFNTWVQGTKPISYEDGRLTIGAHNAYARDWLDSRLRSTVSRLLIGILNRNVDVDFVVSERDAFGEEDAEEKSEEQGGYEVELTSSTRYEEEVKPHRVVVIPGYALRLLAQGDLSAKEMSLWLGFRQAAYFDWKKAGGGASFARNIPYQDVIGFAGMGRASFFRATTGKDSLVGGMIQRLPEIDSHRFNAHLDNAIRWRVSMSPRLTRRDATIIEMILVSDIALAETPNDRITAALQSLEDMTKRSPSDYLDMEIKTPQRAPSGVVEILRRALGIEEDIPAALFEAAEALQNKVINAYGTVHITHHFLKEVAPFFRLTQSQIWTIIVLRDRCFYDYESGEEQDFVMASQGLETLAQWTGVSVKSLKRWLEQPEFLQFVQVLQVKIPEDNRDEGAERLKAFLKKGGLIFQIRKLEPPLAYLQEEDGSLIPLWTKRAMGLDKVSNGSGQSEQRVGTKRVMGLDKVSNAFGQSEHPLNNLFKPLLNPYKPLKAPNSPSSVGTPQKPRGAGVGNSSYWDFDFLMRANAVHPGTVQNFRKDMRKGIPIAKISRVFVSWLLYAYATANAQTDPVAVVIKRMKENLYSGMPDYDRLATLKPHQLKTLFDADLAGDLENDEFCATELGASLEAEIYVLNIAPLRDDYKRQLYRRIFGG